MSILEPGVTVEEAREAIRGMSAPFLLRQYEATPDDFESITDEDFRCEYLDGVLVVHSPATVQHEMRFSFLHTLLNNFVVQRDLGWILGSNAVMQVGQRRFSPDLSFLRKDHADRIQQDRVMGPMDFVIEILSTSTRDYDLREKRTAYREALVSEIWLLDVERQEFHVDWLEASSREPRTAALVQTRLMKDGYWSSPALPGFWIDVAWLLADPLPNALDCWRMIESALTA